MFSLGYVSDMHSYNEYQISTKCKICDVFKALFIIGNFIILVFFPQKNACTIYMCVRGPVKT